MKFLVFSLLALVAADWDMDSDENIMNGSPANNGEIPYQVGIYISFHNTDYFYCGGSLISPTFVLTAAHCLRPRAEDIVAYLGSVNLRKGIRRIGRRKIVHPGWIYGTRPEYMSPLDAWYDIGLLEIEYVALSENIMSVALPDIYDSYPSYETYPTITSGWGRNNISTREASPILLYAELVVISSDACAEIFGSHLPNKTVCGASYTSSGSCSGDSGGPLVLRASTVLIGITSFGTNRKCSDFYATVFTSVNGHRQWINDHTGL